MAKIEIDSEFVFGDRVTSRCNLSNILSDIEIGIVTEFELRPNNLIIYVVTWKDGTSTNHYDFELNKVIQQ